MFGLRAIRSALFNIELQLRGVRCAAAVGAIGRRPRVRNAGTMRIGTNMRVNGRVTRAQFGTGKNGTLVIGDHCGFNEGVSIYAQSSVTLGDYCQIATTFRSSTATSTKSSRAASQPPARSRSGATCGSRAMRLSYEASRSERTRSWLQAPSSPETFPQTAWSAAIRPASFASSTSPIPKTTCGAPAPEDPRRGSTSLPCALRSARDRCACPAGVHRQRRRANRSKKYGGKARIVERPGSGGCAARQKADQMIDRRIGVEIFARVRLRLAKDDVVHAHRLQVHRGSRGRPKPRAALPVAGALRVDRRLQLHDEPVGEAIAERGEHVFLGRKI